MYDPIQVTVLKMQPHHSQSSRENATPSSGTSPLASDKEVLYPPSPGVSCFCFIITAAVTVLWLGGGGGGHCFCCLFYCTLKGLQAIHVSTSCCARAATSAFLFEPHLNSITNVSLADIDECTRDDHECHQDAECINTVGSYNCSCNLGFEGDGNNCKRELLVYRNTQLLHLDDFLAPAPVKNICYSFST